MHYFDRTEAMKYAKVLFAHPLRATPLLNSIVGNVGAAATRLKLAAVTQSRNSTVQYLCTCDSLFSVIAMRQHDVREQSIGCGHGLYEVRCMRLDRYNLFSGFVYLSHTVNIHFLNRQVHIR